MEVHAEAGHGKRILSLTRSAALAMQLLQMYADGGKQQPRLLDSSCC